MFHSTGRFRFALLALALGLTGCGDLFEGGERVFVDPAYFANQRFSCDPQTGERECPPFTCQVDVSGAVLEPCPKGCDRNNVTAFELVGPEGFDLCAPPRCIVRGENQAPECEPGCSDDDTTLYLFLFEC